MPFQLFQSVGNNKSADDNKGHEKSSSTQIVNLSVYPHSFAMALSSNGCHYGAIFFKPEKNFRIFQAKKLPHRWLPW